MPNKKYTKMQKAETSPAKGFYDSSPKPKTRSVTDISPKPKTRSVTVTKLTEAQKKALEKYKKKNKK